MLAIGVTAVQPGLIPLAVLPLLLVVLRIGSGGIDLSLSDFALAAAVIPALLLAKRPFSSGLRAVLWASALYQFATLISVVNNPYAANAVEWAHAWVLVAGSLLVGWAVGANGHGRAGVRLLVGTIAVLALITVIEGVVHFAARRLLTGLPELSLRHAQELRRHRVRDRSVMVYARPTWVGINRRWSILLMSLMLAAVLFTQSRQAVIGLVAAVFVLVLRSNERPQAVRSSCCSSSPHSWLFVTNLVQDQVQSGNQFNSVFQRLTWFQDSMTVW